MRDALAVWHRLDAVDYLVDDGLATGVTAEAALLNVTTSSLGGNVDPRTPLSAVKSSTIASVRCS